MDPSPIADNPALGALAALRRFARPRPARERCDMCDAELADEHAHLLEVTTRRLSCACDACALLFSGQAGTKFRRVPRRMKLLADFRLSDQGWDELQLPIDLAFFVPNGQGGDVTAYYPSPAGATEAPVAPEAWQALAEENPVLNELEPDVEALLVNRIGPERACYRVGIDECYRLVGVIRTRWRGLSGGPEVWAEITRFFEELKARSA